jgi:GDSL-like lipase/acylhydrolase family protein
MQPHPRHALWLTLSGALVAATLVGVLAWPTASVAASAPARVYLALGDSLAYGVGATDVPEQPTAPSPRLGYVPHLSNFFRGASHGGITQTVNLAVGGETSATFISNGQLSGAVNTINEASDIQVVTLDIGGNDLLGLLFTPECADPRSKPCTDLVQAAISNFIVDPIDPSLPGTYPRILGALNGALSTDPSGARLMVMTLYNPFSGTGNTVYETAVDKALLGADGKVDCTAFGNPLRTQDIGMNDAITCIPDIGQFRATVVDVYPVFEGKGPTLTHILDNGTNIHPTNAGYAQIAATFEKAWR